MPIHKTDALVLNKREFRETSLIADLFTRDFGKICGLFKAIRSEPTKFASPLEIFSLNEIIFYSGRSSSLHLVSQCDIKDNFGVLRQSMTKIGVASFMMELLSTLMPLEDKNEEIFDLTVNCLNELKVCANPNKIMTIFKIKVLALSGFKPHFDSCISCADKVSGQSKFSLALGGLLCGKCEKKDFTSRNIFRGTVASILHIEKSDLRGALNLGMNPQIKRELEAILNAFLNFHLEKELKSQKVFNKIAAISV
ncbi:MAG: DNA repair protein RecO [Candidatus Omnitrophota bacterium]|jgi:DNA repair protein RecO (recombination protein O)